ncbi:MAG TPA: amylo-alpha-1,6-glucosidase [Candidatus Limnocylindrales bacterium]
MPQPATAPAAEADARPVALPPSSPTIIPATDLGGVAVLKHANLYLLSDAFGDIHPDTRGLGLYDLDTRVLSCAVLRINGQRPTLLRGHVGADHGASIQLTAPERWRDPVPKQQPSEALSRRAISIARDRWVSDGFAERIRITNFSGIAQDVALELELDADAADIFEVRGYPRSARGTYRPIETSDREITFSYVGLDGLVRRTIVRFSPGVVVATPDRPEAGGEGAVAVRWERTIEPGDAVHLEWHVTTDLLPAPGADAHREKTPTRLARAGARNAAAEAALQERSVADAEYREWHEHTARVRSDGELLDLAIQRGIADLRLLRNDGPNVGEHYLAAGVPWFTTLFGRDTIVTALEVLPFMPGVAVEALRVLADWQATEDDPDRDMEPGKILHELRVGELARTGELPHRPYYGSVDATPLWLVLLEETHRWTGDLDLVRTLWPNVLAALAWIDRYGDRDGDGLVEYERRTPKGLINQGWKDSGDAIRHRDGSLAQAPIALVEVQGYVYDAKVRIARLARRLGEVALAERLEGDAAKLRDRVNELFWMDDVAFYAMGLDADKRQIGSIGSNGGHCLWSGIVPEERVGSVVDRLLDPSLDCGWGIRTYASGQPGFNPVGYHTGSVWPHDNAIIAAGMKRVGRHEAADRVASRMFEAAQHSADFRLPELFCGFDRGVSAAPVPYPVACSPQAWAAGTPLFLLQTMLGMRAEAADGLFELDRPHLPGWLGKVTVHDLRVGDRTVDLLFHRWRGTTTSAEVLRRSAPLEMVIRV